MKQFCAMALTFVMIICLAGCGGRAASDAADVDGSFSAPTQTNDASADSAVSSSSAISADSTTSYDSTAAPETTAAPASGMRPEFKEAMDSYAAFFDEYAAFMKTFNTAGADATTLLKYADFMARYADVTTKLDAVDESELSNEELAYYLQTTAHVQQALAGVA